MNKQLDKTLSEAWFEAECKELWKASVLAFLSTGQKSEYSNYQELGCEVANHVVKEFKNKFGEKR